MATRVGGNVVAPELDERIAPFVEGSDVLVAFQPDPLSGGDRVAAGD